MSEFDKSLIIRGDPTPDEVAAVVVVLAAVRAHKDPVTSGERRPSGWSAYWRRLDAPAPLGPDGWRASGRLR